MTRVTHFRSKFLADERGTMAIILAVSIVILVVVVGLAVDSGRAYSASTKVTAAADTAALAAAKLLEDENLSDSDLRQVAAKAFAANIRQLELGDVSITNFTAFIDRTNSSVKVTANVSVPTTFARLGGVSSIDFTPNTTVTLKAKKIELALVLDVTGSMNLDGRLAAAKFAAKELVDALYVSAPLKGSVKLSLIPYAGAVNLGSAAATASNGASSDNCVVEREGPSAYTDDPLDANAYFKVTNATDAPKYSCPSNRIIPLSDLYDKSDRDAFKSNIDALTASGWTAGHIGIAWGWNTLSPNWDWPYLGDHGKDYDPNKVIKAIIIMTDGMFNTAYKNGGLATEVAGTNEDKTVVGSSPYQALQLCNAMRNPLNPDETIQVYTVAFNAPPAAAALLTDCSGASRFYSAQTASQLSAAFQKIVTNLTSLRLVE